ncbi:glycosyltransferase [Methanobrevibacter millerae]|uniref:CDP-glycerol glycerophosphotransferase, TagB/SpsB family n=1 Tax=Methanobrevibacter millerae TaxID=230361 RepID=A0A1G5WVK8_9EURY|nr:glycosyltransferase [Methanobrevibacter millerae]SDA61706.1 CDP-glycerol glycerophosphotransferase, TagB/SpsB family [Methanobrevibacter millerae]
MHKYKFSIITCFRNSENYIKKSLESIINQSIGFEENIQLILVNDGSTDYSMQIANEYVEKFPNNITLLFQNHLGISYARNLGLKHAEGKYINFLDIGGHLSENALKDIFDFFEENFDEIDVVFIPKNYIGRLNDTDETTLNFHESFIGNLERFPNNPLISISYSFIKYELINDYYFENNLICSEDLLLLNKLLLNKKTYGFIPLLNRKRQNLENILEKFSFNNKCYTYRIKKYYINLSKRCLAEYGNVPKFIQYSLLYDLLTVLKQPELNISENKCDFFRTLNEFLQFIDDDVIFDNEYVDEKLKYFILYLKYGDIDYEIHDFNVIAKIEGYTLDELNIHKFWYDKIELDDDNLHISAVFNSYFDIEDISIVAVKEKNGGYELFKAAFIENDKHKNTRFLSVDWSYAYPFNIKIPIDDLIDSKIRIRVNYHKNGDNTDFDWDNISFSYLDGNFTHNCIFSDYVNNFVKDDLRVSFEERSFFIKRGYKFSVVMAIYNTEDYVGEAIDSIINQSIGFEDNIQLILIDDGSTDNTNNILSEYQKQYPNNIILLTQENQGQATARNNGLKYVQGKYVNFLDSDDYLSEDALEKAFAFLEEHENEIDFASIRQKHFGRKDSQHMLNYRFNEGDRIIDLIEEPNNPQLACNAVFFKNNLFNKYKFPANVVSSEDAIMVNKILFEKKKYGVLEEPVYYYRKREDLTSTIDLVTTQKEFFTDKLKYYYLELINYSLEKEGEVLEFIQYMLAYDLQWMLQEPNVDILENETKISEFWYYLNHVINFIDYDVIVNNRNINIRLLKQFFIYLKNDDIYTEIAQNTALIKTKNYGLDDFQDHNIWLDIVEIHNGFFNISGLLYSHFNTNHVSIGAVKESLDGTYQYYGGKDVNYTSRQDLTYLGITWEYRHTFDIKVPISEGEVSNIKVKATYHINGDKTDFSKSNVITAFHNLDFNKHAGFSNTSNYLIKDSMMALFEDNKFLIRPYSYTRMIKYECDVLARIIKEHQNHFLSAVFYRFLYLISYPFVSRKHKKNPTFIFMDRIESADDNAFYLFKYAVSQKDNVNKYFALSKDSKDFSKVSKVGKVLKYDSFRHKMKYLFADKVISSHTYQSTINPFFTDDEEIYLYSSITKPDSYFLQHGVAKEDLSSWFSKYDKNVRLVLTSADSERESFLQEGYNYDEDIVKAFGLPRHDYLWSDDKKQILITPTWRKNLRGSKSLFMGSDYFKSLNELLHDEKLINVVEKYGFKIVFKPHPELERFVNDDERYLDLFEIDERIKIVNEVSYQKLFAESSLLITDFSSVFFDFTYLKKPLIYYQPNDDYHYEEDYFDYETMGFGDVITEKDILINKIEFYLNNGCIMEEEYQNRADTFFKHHDGKNSERIYDWIKNH